MRDLVKDTLAAGRSAAPGDLGEKINWDHEESLGQEDFKSKTPFEAEKSDMMDIVARHKTNLTTREPR